jgi:hypothetical protein
MKPIAVLVGFLLATVTLGYRPEAMGRSIYVVTHNGVKLDARSIRDIYIGERQFMGTTRIIPLDNAAGQAEFLHRVLKLDQTRYTNLWIKKSFRDALNPPAIKGSDKEILDIVRTTPGAIGYVTTPPPADVVTYQQF